MGRWDDWDPKSKAYKALQLGQTWDRRTKWFSIIGGTMVAVWITAVISYQLGWQHALEWISGLRP